MTEFVRITSPKNPIVKRFKAAAAGDADGVMVADGVVLVGEAIAAGCVMREVVTSPRLVASAKGRDLRRQMLSSGIATQDCSDEVLERISHLSTHQGVAALLQRPAAELEDMAGEHALILVAAGVRDPGNLGALIRTAEAAGATGVVALAGSADPFRDKAVRGSAGSIFRVPVAGGVSPERLAAWLPGTGMQIVAADAKSSDRYTDLDLKRPTALVLGGEADGVPDLLASIATAHALIPMSEPVESLNVAVAAGVLLFEARRQRS